MNKKNISTDFPYTSNYVEVQGSKMHYVEKGKGNPILFLHGVPTSSYIWRNVIPHLSTLGRCIAPDLIGMGKSDKPNIEYSIFDHIKYIESFIEALQLKRVTLVMHGWGSIIGLNYAMQHEKNCRGLVMYESYLRPFHTDDVSLPFQEQIAALEAQESMHDIVMNGCLFVDKALAQGMMQPLSDIAMAQYREPFLKEGTGKPLHQYLQELLPRTDKQSTVDKLIADYSKKLTQSRLPKLLLYSVPGFITTIATIMWAKEHLPNIELVEIGEALHYAQESDPTLMGETMSVWLQGIEATT